MIFKLLTLAAIIYVVYILFFKKNNQINTTNEDEDIMIQCPTCNTFVTKDDAILSNGKYYCSKECLK